ncbi:sporulation delaying protein family toxin [Paenibacillus sp. KS-LC4]|uniref:sporulation delaying protein family toxin n=1 Tax=Paenibacillus sp. KS-LC4 TaxID=2979727 RepID=UPI0030CCD088
MNFKGIISILMVAVFIMTSSSAIAASPGSTAKTKFNGETIFRGLVFGQGEAAKLLPDIWTKDLLSKVNTPEAATVANNVVASIKKLDPTYFNTLEKAAYSGNHIQVRAALNRGGELIEKAFQGSQVSNPQVGTGTGDCAAVVAGYLYYAGAVFTTGAAVTHVAVITAGGAVAAYLVVVGGKYFWTSSASAQESSLKQDMLVNSVVKAFAK